MALTDARRGDRFHPAQRACSSSTRRLKRGWLRMKSAPGGSTSTSIALSANNAFSGPVTLACMGAPASTTCSFSQRRVTLAPGQTVTSTLTLRADRTASLQPGVLGGAVSGLAVCCLLLISPWLRRRKFAARLALAVLASIGAAGAIGCAPDTAPKPSAGTYALSVTATPSDPGVPGQTLTVVVVAD